MASLRRRQDIIGNRHVFIEPLRIAGDVGKFPFLRVQVEAGFRVRKPDPGKVNHRVDILEMIQ
jgi:hypothetical protein